MELTYQQSAILLALTKTTDNLGIIARAGCGKTSTILLCVDELIKTAPEKSSIICAYNKAIRDEIKAKLDSKGIDFRQCQASTMHSIGLNLIKQINKEIKVDAKKVWNIIDQTNSVSAITHKPFISELVEKAKGEGFGYFPDRRVGNFGDWEQMISHYDISYDLSGNEEKSEYELLQMCIQAAAHVYEESLRRKDVVDFGDMILWPLINGIPVKYPFDNVLADEVQDFSRVRQALARKLIKPRTGRMIIVGDDRQAIYGFSGADADALPNMISSMSAKVFPLSKTFRCPIAVVAEAQHYVPDIEAAEWAKPGSVSSASVLPADLDKNTAILCRNTAPLIGLAFKLISSGIAAKVEGRDIGRGLQRIIGRWKKIKLIEEFLVKLDGYELHEEQKAKARGDEAKEEQVHDTCGTLRAIAKGCLAKGEESIADMSRAIEDLFADDVRGCVTLCTYHRSKGREWPRVLLYRHRDLCPSKYAKQPWQRRQEDNLAYVAITRAQAELVYLDAAKLPTADPATKAVKVRRKKKATKGGKNEL